MKKQILISVWSAQHKNADQNIQQQTFLRWGAVVMWASNLRGGNMKKKTFLCFFFRTMASHNFLDLLPNVLTRDLCRTTNFLLSTEATFSTKTFTKTSTLPTTFQTRTKNRRLMSKIITGRDRERQPRLIPIRLIIHR